MNRIFLAACFDDPQQDPQTSSKTKPSCSVREKPSQSIGKKNPRNQSSTLRVFKKGSLPTRFCHCGTKDNKDRLVCKHVKKTLCQWIVTNTQWPGLFLQIEGRSDASAVSTAKAMFEECTDGQKVLVSGQ